LTALESTRSFPQCLCCKTLFVCTDELHLHLNKFPSHNATSTPTTLVDRPVKDFVAEIMDSLDSDQRKVAEQFLAGHHIMLVAPAGCGKTHTTKAIYRMIMAMYGEVYFLRHVQGIGTTNNIANHMSFLAFQGLNNYYINIYIFFYLLFPLFFMFKIKHRHLILYLDSVKGKRKKPLTTS
jgi:hypothetical protein